MKTKNTKNLTAEQSETLIGVLKTRFEKHMNRHRGIDWANIQAKLKAAPEKLRVLNEMELTGGEPDVVGYLAETDEYLFFDCSEETPKGRRSLCYDREGLDSRKDNKPESSATDMAADMGVELLTEKDYRTLQSLGHFDSKTSSWIQTPLSIRKLGGALFADFRYGTVFVYHNTAGSYYGVRGFRGMVQI